MLKYAHCVWTTHVRPNCTRTARTSLKPPHKKVFVLPKISNEGSKSDYLFLQLEKPCLKSTRIITRCVCVHRIHNSSGETDLLNQERDEQCSVKLRIPNEKCSYFAGFRRLIQKRELNNGLEYFNVIARFHKYGLPQSTIIYPGTSLKYALAKRLEAPSGGYCSPRL